MLKIYFTLKLYKENCHDHWRPCFSFNWNHFRTRLRFYWETLTSRVLRRNNCLATWQPYIIRTNVLTKFHEDWTINLTSTEKTAPPPGGHVFLPTGIIFELVKDLIGTHVPTKFHDDWTKNITSRVFNKENCHAPWHAGFSTTRSIFKLVQDINGTHVLTKFHEDWTINVTSKVLTR
ncbi:hypothetical protein DPMN_054312 [Dreissena polymorpha]|uniref:Uncharacterized protein n=1 Tax=Dreissena polymorpha TaxID=45954 RepID=A0A9D4CMX4_DREPO|nr:hypothetical protein DPMN_054312 [Dreissena polymorpha]